MCSRCVMDTSDPKIVFDDSGVCSHCRAFAETISLDWSNQLKDRNLLNRTAKSIKRRSINRPYDCIIGLSGGLDSSYAAHIAVNICGLRPLLLHVDAGWNTAQAVKNIHCIVNGLRADLYTHVVDWQSVRRMQLAFLKSGIPDQDLVQDAAFFSSMYNYARHFGIKDIITGSNYSTECCREPEEWGGYLGIDKRLFGDIWRKHGDSDDISLFPVTDILKYKFWNRVVNGMKVHHPLNMIEYSKVLAEKELNREFGWKPFVHKHHESRFTRFYEDYWLKKRFGYDKRRAHFSSLIMTGQMKRGDALRRLERGELSEKKMYAERLYIAMKLGLTINELDSLETVEKRTYRDYKNKRDFIKLGAKLYSVFGKEKRNVA